MNMVKYISIFFPLSLIFCFVLFTSSSMGHNDQVHTLVDLSEKTKAHIQDCIAQPEFQDSCYFELCGDEGSYLCTQDILEAVVQLAGPEKGGYVLDSIMESSLFAIQTDGHLLAHVLGKSIAHNLGFTGESLIRCPQGYNWGCMHGFFEDELAQVAEPVKVAAELCESLPDRPGHRKYFCYHGIGHIFMFNASYDLMHALSLCDVLPTPKGQDGCHQGVLMENSLIIIETKDDRSQFSETKEKQGFLDSDPLAPCNRIAKKYRLQCYANHGYYLFLLNDFSVEDTSRICLDAGDEIVDCMFGIALYTADTWQEVLMEKNPIEPFRETTEVENFAYLCNKFPFDYIQVCHEAGLSSFLSYDRIHDAVSFCSLFGINKNECFRYIGLKFDNISRTNSEAMQICETVPQEFQEYCMQGVQLMPHDVSASTQQNNKDTGSLIQNNNKADNGTAATSLSYLFITLGSILLMVPLVYYFRYRK